MMLQRLATGATGVKQARYRRRPTRAARHSHAHAQYIHNASVCAYEFRRSGSNCGRTAVYILSMGILPHALRLCSDPGQDPGHYNKPSRCSSKPVVYGAPFVSKMERHQFGQ